MIFNAKTNQVTLLKKYHKSVKLRVSYTNLH